MKIEVKVSTPVSGSVLLCWNYLFASFLSSVLVSSVSFFFLFAPRFLHERERGLSVGASAFLGISWRVWLSMDWRFFLICGLQVFGVAAFCWLVVMAEGTKNGGWVVVIGGYTLDASETRWGWRFKSFIEGDEKWKWDWLRLKWEDDKMGVKKIDSG